MSLHWQEQAKSEIFRRLILTHSDKRQKTVHALRTESLFVFFEVDLLRSDASPVPDRLASVREG